MHKTYLERIPMCIDSIQSISPPPLSPLLALVTKQPLEGRRHQPRVVDSHSQNRITSQLIIT